MSLINRYIPLRAVRDQIAKSLVPEGEQKFFSPEFHGAYLESRFGDNSATKFDASKELIENIAYFGPGKAYDVLTFALRKFGFKLPKFSLKAEFSCFNSGKSFSTSPISGFEVNQAIDETTVTERNPTIGRNPSCQIVINPMFGEVGRVHFVIIRVESPATGKQFNLLFDLSTLSGCTLASRSSPDACQTFSSSAEKRQVLAFGIDETITLNIGESSHTLTISPQ